MAWNTAFKQVTCALTQHQVSPEIEDQLFEGDVLELDTNCSKCGTPLHIEREQNDEEFYYISERVVIQLPA